MDKFEHTPYMSAPQIRGQQAEIKRQVMAIVDNLQLRKWAVEQAVRLATDVQYSTISGELLKEITKFFYDFVTQKETDNEKSA